MSGCTVSSTQHDKVKKASCLIIYDYRNAIEMQLSLRL